MILKNNNKNIDLLFQSSGWVDGWITRVLLRAQLFAISPKNAQTVIN
jgi:hypothetical protein